jgi:Mg-chelatase subunit ChlD
MAPATVNPTTPNEIQYTIQNSTAFIANFTLDVAPGAQESFSFTHPDPQAGAVYSLVYISPGGARTTIPLPAGGAVANFAVSGDQGAPSGGNSVLAVNVTEMNGTGPNPGELWELRVNADATGQYTFDAPSTNMEVHWLAVDPVADLVVPATVFEKEEVTLNAANANPAGTVAGVLPATIAPTYTWTHTGLNPITELPTTTTTPSFKVTPKDVYDPVPVPFTVTTTFADAANLYTGFLQTASVPETVTVNQRRQQVVLVIDRSGSMALENRYDNAKAACRVLVHLFAGLREGVNAGDRIGIVAFEDEVAGFRGGGPSTRIQAILPLSSVPDAVAAIDDPAFDFGAPGTNTPIGDGLVFAIDLLAAQGPITDQNFNLVLVSDGLENCGHVALDPTLATGGAISFTTAISSLFPARKAVAEASRFHINGIALGPTANPSQMNQLATQFKGVFAHVNNAFELASTFAGILQPAQDVNQVTEQLTPTTGVADPDAASFPAGANALYLTTEDEVDRLVVSVLPPAGSTVITDTIQLARWDGASYLPVTATVLATESDRSVSVSKLPDIANGQSLHWRVIHGTGPSTAHPLDVSQALCYVDLHLLADVILDKPRYGTGDRMTLTVRIRQDFRPVLGSTIRAKLTAPGVGLGEELSAIGDVPDDDRDRDSKDTLTWLERRINALLGKRNWRHLPTTQPTGLFVDNTDQLFDPEGDGNYTNTFARVFKEGTYAWELFVDGLTVTGNPYTRSLAISTFATVKVSPKKTTIKVTRVHNHPSRMLAARIVVTPQDARGERLGPGHDVNVIWSLKDGVFEDIFDKEPPPVFADGTYQRVILYGPRQRPVVVVKAAKVTLPTIDVRRALLGFDDDDDDRADKTTSVDGS